MRPSVPCSARVIWIGLISVVVLYAIFMAYAYFGGVFKEEHLEHPPHSLSRRVAATFPLQVRVDLGRESHLDHGEDGNLMYKKSEGTNKVTDNEVTVMIKTMDRPSCVRKLIFDIHDHHPNITILVADDGDYSAWTEEDHYHHHFVKYFRMPQDSGLSAGRNLMLSQVQTPYVLSLDDDFLWNPLMLKRLMYVMELHPYLDLVAGRIGENSFAGFMHVLNSTLFLMPGQHGHLEGTSNLKEDEAPGTPCGIVDFVPNYFLARTDTIMSLQWYNHLKLGEHAEFFLRFNFGNYKAAFCPDIFVANQQSKCAEVLLHNSAEEVERKRKIKQDRAQGYIKQSLAIHNLNAIAYCLGDEYHEPGWSVVNPTPSLECHVVPLPKDCPAGFTGPKCDQCLPLHYGPQCLPCECKHGLCAYKNSSDSANNSSINSNAAGIVGCVCQVGWVGVKCDTPASVSADLIRDPSFASLATPEMAKWTPFGDGCINKTADGIWLNNNGNLTCGASVKVTLNQTQPGLVKIAGQSMCMRSTKRLDNSALYSIFANMTFTDNTMQSDNFESFESYMRELNTKELLLRPHKPVREVVVYVLLKNLKASVYFQNVTLHVQLPP